MKEKLKKSSGITLIALIITIIVMLILVAVTVNLANENGGLFVTTRKAASETQAAAEKETLSAELVGAIKAGGEFDISAVNLPDNMKWCDEGDNDFNSVSKGQPSKGEASWVITKNNNKFYVDAYGNVQNESTQESITWEEARTKGWVYLEEDGEKTLWYCGPEKTLSITKKLYKVPVFESTGEEGVDPIFKGYIDSDTTENGILITFFDNKNIESVNWGGLNVVLATDGFAWCTKLKSVTGMEGMTEIPTGAFEGCTSLTNITIPSNIIKIGDGSNVFEECTNLTQIIVNKAQDSISGAPWGAPNATVTWQE